jgi:hypothetical protein
LASELVTIAAIFGAALSSLPSDGSTAGSPLVAAAVDVR